MRIPGVVSSERIAWQKENFSELFISSHVVLVETPEFHQVLGFCLRSECSATKPTQTLIVHQISTRIFKI